MSPPRKPNAGDVLHIGREASVQFAKSPFFFRLIGVCKEQTYDGWVWLTGYQLDANGNAVAKREIFVMRAGLRPVPSKRQGRK